MALSRFRHFSTLGLVVLAAASVRAAEPAKNAFDAGKIWKVELTLSAKEFAAMQPQGAGNFPGFGPPPAPKPMPVEKPGEPVREVHRNTFGVDLPWATGSVVVNGEEFKNVGVRYKGNGTIGDSSRTIKKSIKIDLDHFGGAGKFNGSKTINLHSEVTDPSKSREKLGYALYTAAGVPAPRTSLAEVWLTVPDKFDKELLGVYNAVESVDKSFLNAKFGDDKGLLMKPEGLREFEYKGEKWKDYSQQYAAKREPTKDEAKRVIAFAKLVQKASDEEFAKEIGAFLEIDGYLRFLAVTAFESNTDSLFVGGHNFYMYLNPKTAKLHFFPWDLDRSFANFPILGSNEQMMNLSLKHPYAGRHRLTDRLLAIPSVSEQYQNLLKDLAKTVFAKETLLKELEKAEEAVKEPLARDAKATAARKEPAGGGGMNFGKPPSLKVFFEKRTESLLAQIEGKSKGFIPIGGFGQPMAYGDMMAGPMLEARDSDKDSKISKEEWLATVKKVFDAAEKDKDGKAGEKAIADSINGMWPQPEGQPRGFPGPGAMFANPILKRADADKDGKLTLAEMEAAAKKLFDDFDKAKAGKIDEAKFAEMLNELFPQPNFGPPGGGPGGPPRGPGGPPRP